MLTFVKATLVHWNLRHYGKDSATKMNRQLIYVSRFPVFDEF